MFADFIVLTHFIFILFVVFGGLLTIKFKWTIFFHIPAVVWGAVIEFTHGVCPLTIWENQLRHSMMLNMKLDLLNIILFH